MTTVCPFCKDRVSEDSAVICPACESAHHEDCWEANHFACSVFGCDSKSVEDLFGCPWCDEVYPYGDRIACMSCGSPLMTAEEYQQVVSGTEWVRISLPPEENPMLVAGYLRNNGLSARTEKRIPVSMLLPAGPAALLVPREDEEGAQHMLKDLAARFTRCSGCGHVLAQEETDCSYCEESGAKS
jgi:hypothetical protein